MTVQRQRPKNSEAHVVGSQGSWRLQPGVSKHWICCRKMPGDARLLREMAFDVCMPLQANQIWIPARGPGGFNPVRNSADSAQPQLRFTEACLGTLHLRPANDVGLLSQPTCTRARTGEWPRAWPSKLSISSHLGHASQPLLE